MFAVTTIKICSSYVWEFDYATIFKQNAKQKLYVYFYLYFFYIGNILNLLRVFKKIALTDIQANKAIL